MDCRCQQTFPRSGFSLDQNGRESACYFRLAFEQPRDLIPDLYDLGMLSEE